MALNPRKGGVLGPASVATDALQPNPHNPRLLFDKQPLETLKTSIEKVGILVPITVFRAKGASKYTILDGQRRWICAQELMLNKVPINEVKEPSLAQNIVMMFQIHKLRLDWELMPTALKLDVLMKELNEKRDRQLSELTGLDVAVVTRCKKLLSYPKDMQDRMLFAKPEDRIKADFFIELYPIINDRTVKKSRKFKARQLTEVFIEKYESRSSGIKSVTDFRRIKQSLTTARVSNHEAEALKRFEEYVSSETKDISHLEIDTAQIHREATQLTKAVHSLKIQISEIKTDSFSGEEELWKELEALLTVIRKVLQRADRRAS
jgi:ParB family transcriptional regulator, chromosome partitioning protein